MEARLRTERWRMRQMIAQRKAPRALVFLREEREKALRRLMGLMGYSQDEAEQILLDKAEERRPKS
jgi:SOS response regulatory protein OraA/RecX